MLENESNAVNILNEQVKSLGTENVSTPTLKISDNPTVITPNKHMELVKKCCKTPLLYFTLVPVIILLIFLLARPSYIYDTDKQTKKKKINLTRFLGSVIGIIIAADLFIYFYLIKHCKYNL